MTSFNRVLKCISNVNHCVIDDVELRQLSNGSECLHIYVRLKKGHKHHCPICGIMW